MVACKKNIIWKHEKQINFCVIKNVNSFSSLKQRLENGLMKHISFHKFDFDGFKIFLNFFFL